MDFYLYPILFFGVIASGASVFLFKKQDKKTLKLLLSFSGSYLFAISILHLIPEVFSETDTPTKIGVFVLVGFFIQILLELFSEGIEHGHVHIHNHTGKVFPVAIILSLCLHSFLEGMPLHTNTHDHNHDSLLWGILLHKIPVAFAFTSMLLQSNVSKNKTILFLTIFALTAPLGALFSSYLGESLYDFYSYIMAVVIGMFLHISTTILFEASEGHKFNLVKFVIIILGAGVAFLSII